MANVNNGGLSTGLWNAIDTDALDTLTDSRQEGCHNPWQFAKRIFRGPHRRRIGPRTSAPLPVARDDSDFGATLCCVRFWSESKEWTLEIR